MFNRRSRTSDLSEHLRSSAALPGTVPRFGCALDGRGVEHINAIEDGARDRAVVDGLVAKVDSGSLQTATGGRFELSAPERDVCAFLSGGVFVVSDPRGLDESVDALWASVWAAGDPVVQIVRVSPAALARLYHAAAGAGVAAPPGVVEAESWLYSVVAEASAQAASDVHVSCDPAGVTAALRVDGMIELIEVPPSRAVAEAVLRLLPELADRPVPDALARGLPLQCSGRRFALPPGVGALRVRLARLAGGGAQAVLRVFGPWSSPAGSGLSALGYLAVHRAALARVRESGPGLVVVAGPTGAGKSTALRAFISALGAERVPAPLIVTAESPVEVVLPGVRQLDVLPGSASLRAALDRLSDSDPDVAVVGEVRTRRLLRAVVETAGAGYALWTTLHASDVQGAVARLVRAVRDPDQVAAVLRAVLAQRLVPVLCRDCSAYGSAAREALGVQSAACLHAIEELYAAPLGSGVLASVRVRRRGVHACTADGCRRGVLGRTVVSELALGSSAELVGPSLSEHALMLVRAGRLDPLDAMRSTGFSPLDPGRALMLDELARAERLL